MSAGLTAFSGLSPGERVLAVIERVRADLTPGMLRWLHACSASGMSMEAVVHSLMENGRDAEVADLLPRLAKRGDIPDFLQARNGSRMERSAATVAHSISHRRLVGDSEVRTLVSMGRDGMELAVYDGLITDEEIESLLCASRGRLGRSQVGGAIEPSQISVARTSEGAFLPPVPALAALEERVASLTGFPRDHGEAWQVLHYIGQQEYQPHYDFFAGELTDPVALGRAGDRVGTLIFYLNDPEEGGSTYFPILDLAVHPHRGLALWFRYLHAGRRDRRSLHAGMPLMAGEKWVATKWIRSGASLAPRIQLSTETVARDTEER